MKSPARVASPLLSCLLVACAGVGGTAAPVGVADPAPKAEAESAAEKLVEERRLRERELEQKRRELDYARIAVQTGAIERQVRTMTVENAVQSAQLQLDKHRRELDLFVQQQRPRELDDQRVSLDHRIHSAEEAKEELAELEAMYKEDEFARSTKELVIRRGRRSVEMAERQLAIGRQEFAEFEQHELVERERTLRQAVKDAELGLEKSRLEHQKAQLDLDVQQRQADDKVKDLQRDIDELEAKAKVAEAKGS